MPESEGEQEQQESQSQRSRQSEPRPRRDMTADGERLDPEVLIAKYGDARAALQKVTTKQDRLERERYEGRRERDQLQDEIDRLKSQIPSDERVLSEEQRGQLEEIGLFGEDNALNLTALREKLEAGQEARQRLSRLEKREQYRKAADAEGIDNFEALDRLLDDESLSVETERNEDGDEVQFAQVTYEEDGEEKTVRLREYDKLKPFSNSLFGSSGDEEDSNRRQRPRMPQQGSTTRKKEEEDQVDSFLRELEEIRSGQQAAA